MANREHNDPSSIKVIERDVRALAKLDNPLAEFRKHSLYRSADLWMSRESLNPSSEWRGEPLRDFWRRENR